MSKIKDFYFEQLQESIQDICEPVNPPHLIIIRGLPGSGKTTLAKQLTAWDTDHYEADQFFEIGGKYKFEHLLLDVAHQWCFSNTAWSLKRGRDVVVSNTFTELWEMTQYLDLRTKIACTISIVEMQANYGSVRGIPPHIFGHMQRRWEIIPPEWLDDGLMISYRS